MITKVIAYEDLDGNRVEDEFCFKLSTAEAAELELGYEGGGLSSYLMRVLEDGDKGAIIKTFRELISLSVGRRSPNGRRFIKDDETRDDFMQSDAFSTLFMELMTDSNKAVEFFKGIMPKELAEKAEAELNGEYTHEQLLAMSDSEFRAVAGTDPTKMDKQMLMVAFQRKGVA